MSCVKLLSFLVCLGIFVTKINAQINPLFFLGDFGEDLLELYGGDGGGSYLYYNKLNSRLQALETNVRTGAIGGCESGLIGTFTPTSRTRTFTFNNNFLLQPTLTLAVSDLTSVDATQVLNFSVRPTSVSNTGGTVTLTDANDNVASPVVSYMACPSNGSPAVSNTGMNVG